MAVDVPGRESGREQPEAALCQAGGEAAAARAFVAHNSAPCRPHAQKGESGGVILPHVRLTAALKWLAIRSPSHRSLPSPPPSMTEAVDIPFGPIAGGGRAPMAKAQAPQQALQARVPFGDRNIDHPSLGIQAAHEQPYTGGADPPALAKRMDNQPRDPKSVFE